MKKLALLFPVLAMIFLASTTQFMDAADEEADRLKADKAAIESALMDYVEGLYTVDTTRIYRSVHPTLKKRGYWFNPEKSAYTEPLDMSFKQLVKLTASWNAKGNRADDSSIKEVEVFDILDKTATGKVTAVWGIDYAHLAKSEDGQWHIMNILWQSHPPKTDQEKGQE